MPQPLEKPQGLHHLLSRHYLDQGLQPVEQLANVPLIGHKDAGMRAAFGQILVVEGNKVANVVSQEDTVLAGGVG